MHVPDTMRCWQLLGLAAALECVSPAAQVKSAALQARLQTLQRDLDEKEYGEMVADITAGVRFTSSCGYGRSIPQGQQPYCRAWIMRSRAVPPDITGKLPHYSSGST